MDLVNRLRQTVAGSERRVVLPEGDDLRVLQAAVRLRDERLAQPVLLGCPETMQTTAAAAGMQLDDLTLIDPRADKDFDRYVDAYASRRELPAKVAARMMRRPALLWRHDGGRRGCRHNGRRRRQPDRGRDSSGRPDRRLCRGH